MFRIPGLVLSALLLIAADYPPPPPQLEPYIKDGRFDPGDYGWMKGRFADSTPEEQETLRTIQRWANECRDGAIAELRAKLQALGYADPQVQNIFTGPLLCQEVMIQPQLAEYGTFEALQRERAAAEAVADAFLTAVALAEEIAAPRQQDFAKQAAARRIADQALRSPSMWSRPGAPRLTPVGFAIVQSRLTRATFAYDHDNTAWLKGFVAEHGWPKISEVGEEASGVAWLLVQHADADPLFQLEALHLMEPLVAQGEVSKQNYAYLYDRIMLKLAGRQRYATQVICQEGVRRPLPLEDEAAVDRLRGEMGLPTLAEYVAQFDKNVPCSSLPENSIRIQGGSLGATSGGFVVR